MAAERQQYIKLANQKNQQVLSHWISKEMPSKLRAPQTTKSSQAAPVANHTVTAVEEETADDEYLTVAQIVVAPSGMSYGDSDDEMEC